MFAGTTGLDAALIATVSILASALVGAIVAVVRSKADKSALQALEAKTSSEITGMDTHHKELIGLLRSDLQQHRESDERFHTAIRSEFAGAVHDIRSDINDLRETLVKK